MSYYFSKRFAEFNLDNVDYWLCPNCGLTASKTHFDLAQNEWEALDFNFHVAHNSRTYNPYHRNQRNFYQAQMLHLMLRHGLISGQPWLD